MLSTRRVVVTGIGALTPIGNDALSFWDGLLNGKSGAGAITKFDASKFRTKFACEVKDFNVESYIDRKEASRIDPFCQYALAVSIQAMQDSGIDTSKIDLDKAGVIFGSGIGGLRTFLDEIIAYAKGDGTPRFSPFFIPKMIIDLAAGHISMKFGFRGINYAAVSACATSTHCVIESFNHIRYGRADVMICGGAEAAVNEAGIGGFNAMRALSERNDDLATASRPFDKNRDGFVLGEGAGALILEDLDHALARGAKIYAEVAGTGMTADAYHMTAPHPEGLGAQKVMEMALREAGFTAADIDYVNVHGTSTPLGDVAELKAISKVFGDDIYNLNISSTKSMTGHLLGAAGVIEAIACTYAVYHDIVPPTINHFEDDPEIDPRLNLTFHTPQKRVVDAALSNTFGFGGHNASVIMKKYKA
ncbi:MAG: beta-ketoacyl-ACP synthase II [Bacteroidetes bacterium]|nr:beta-ketoacyl-ACP synthase II [Bacteroidota bacterium]